MQAYTDWDAILRRAAHHQQVFFPVTKNEGKKAE